MGKIAIYGNNKISEFLQSSLVNHGFETIDITNEIKIQETISNEKFDAVLDVSNAEFTWDEKSEFIHNTAEIKDLIDLSAKLETQYVFVYREKEDTHPESPLVTAQDLITSYCGKKNIGFAKVQIEDIYGPDINTSPKLDSFIQNIIEGTNLVVDNDENEHYLLHQSDFLNGIIKGIDSIDQNSTKHFTLYPEDSITEIELAHFITELTDLEIQIEYSHEDIGTSAVFPDAETSYPDNWYPEMPLESGINDLFSYFDIPIPDTANAELQNEQTKLSQEKFADKTEPKDIFEELDSNFDSDINTNEPDNITLDTDASLDNEPPHHLTNEVVYDLDDNEYTNPYRPASKAKKIIGGLTAVLFLTLSMPSLIFGYHSISGIKSLENAHNAFAKADYENAINHSQKSINHISKLYDIPTPIKLALNLAGVDSENQYRLINTYENTAEVISFAASTFEDALNLALSTETGVLGTQDTRNSNEFDHTINLIDKIQSNINILLENDIPLTNLLSRNLSLLEKDRSSITKLKTLTNILPEILGYTEEQRYIVLLQNESKIRPNGGVVEAFGIISLREGQIQVLEVADSDSMNDQIKLNRININPPTPIQLAQDVEHHYMKDILWSPDFRKSADAAMKLYSSVYREPLNGAIAINLSSLSKLNGSEIKTDLFQSDYADILETTLNEIRFAETQTLMKQIMSMLDNNSIKIYHSKTDVQSQLLKNNWAGDLKLSNTDDYLYIIDSDMLENGSYSKVHKKISYTGDISDLNNGYTRKVSLEYTNMSNNDFLTHIRIVTPSNTLINSALVIDGETERNITRSVGATLEGTLGIYDLNLFVPAGQNRVVSIEYQSMPQLSTNQTDFTLYLQKQPGTPSIPLSVKMEGSNSRDINTNFESNQQIKFPL